MKALGSRLANWRVIVPVLGLLFACGLLAAGSASASIPRDASAPHVSSAAGSVPPPGNHAPDGSCLQWRIVPSANFTNTYIVSNELQAVEVVAPDNVWAVGYHEAYPNEQTLVTHWDGNAWSLVPSPNLGSGRSKLYGIDALAADDIWAVGESENRSFIIHWDGIDWSVVPHPYSSVLWGVAAVGSNDVWAVGEITGRAMIQHWDGTQWSIVSVPSINSYRAVLFDVEAASANDVWAVGWYLNPNIGRDMPLILHWDGNTWNLVPSPGRLPFDNELYSLKVLSSTDIRAVGASYDGGSSQMLMLRWDGSLWSLDPSPTFNYISVLFSVTATGPDDVWAAGYYYDVGRRRTLTVHWDGAQWSVVPSPNPSDNNTKLTGIAAVAATDVWAVGSYFWDGNTIWTLAERYTDPCSTPTPTPTFSPTVIGTPPTFTGTATPRNTRTATFTPTSSVTWTFTRTPTFTRTAVPACGLAWRVVSSPNPSGNYLALNAVSAISASDIWAVGRLNISPARNLTMHWDGTQWTIVPSPNVGSRDNYLTGVVALAPNDVWAVGLARPQSVYSQNLVLHWDGTQWNVVSVPHPGPDLDELYGIAAVADDDIWAVGYQWTYPNNGQTEVLHWDGSGWDVVPSPNSSQQGDVLMAVTAISATDVWAVGYSGPQDAWQPLAMHWNGVQWTIVPTPLGPLSPSRLRAVSGTASNDVWAVGDYGPYYAAQTLIMHWDGAQWTIVPAPNTGGGLGAFYAVLAITPQSAWAVGSAILRWDGTQWSEYNGYEGNVLYGLDLVDSTDIWGVGTVGTTQTLTERYSDPCATPTPTSTRTVTPTGTPPSPTRTRTPGLTRTPTYTPSATNTSPPASTPTNTATQTGTPTASPTCGPAWRLVTNPNATDVYFNEFRGVAAVSSSDVWAVGEYDNWDHYRTLIEHWDGSAWSIVPSPNAGTGNNKLAAVAAVTANDIWAVGYYDVDFGTRALILHWDGQAWAQAASPSAGSLNGVAVISANDVWAVGALGGSTLTVHWDGTQWTAVQSPNTANTNWLTAVAAISANDVWAVGVSIPFRHQTFTIHWDGGQWTIVPSPNVGAFDNYLNGVAAIASNDVWAVGSEGSTGENMSLHWDGSVWSVVSVPTPPDTYASTLNAVAARSSGDLWAVGFANGGGPRRTEVVHWNGTQWSLVPSPNFGSDNSNYLYGVAVLRSEAAEGNVWAVGDVFASVRYPTLVLRYYDPCASAPNTATPLPTTAVSATGTATSTATGTATRTATRTPTSTPSNTVLATRTATGTTTAVQVLTSTPPSTETPCPMSFTDVPPDHTFYREIRYLYCRGVVSGYGDNTFRPGNPTTRGQLTKIVVLAEGWTIYTPPSPTFRDVPTDHTFYSFIETAASRGVISGYSCGAGCLEFRPANSVTRGQIAKIVVLAEGWQLLDPPAPTFSDVPRDHPFFSPIETAYAHNIISGYSCGPGCLEYRPGNNATRGQICKIVTSAVTLP